ncbi:D-aminoacyl-tRNA deacylase [Alkalitalea saponilacus]|uniref:D-aminoacyl-tRNA deacylase n=1 Tax=Alkalitalea saponilacus TaxID=889453 RepID=A0A1T5E9B6_9BACT|nr:D-aminoacyl-tRNA deacylase [Alkalitalea saponilacus]ASB49067.1 D-tyrosyl-tRNA(Tyr) deacylase [Alkalitalea saponilacus]SKB80672.1 D-tyrosyl-tRNA(Tyr) deacylase [Alkalitalea saponilacus]
MRLVIQRVNKSEVSDDTGLISSIGQGLMILCGIEHRDSKEDVQWLAKKVAGLRIFDNENGVMNYSLVEIGGEAMVVSQFTLHARYKKGNRPSYIDAAPPEHAIPLYEYFVELLTQLIGKPVASGKFGAHMKINLINDGPVTILMDSQNRM